jgi:hypothetical protein
MITPPPMDNLWVPTVVQNVVKIPGMFVKQIVLLIELSPHIRKRVHMDINVSEDRQYLEVIRPRGKSINDTLYVSLNIMDDKGIDKINVPYYIGALEEALVELRMHMKTVIPNDKTHILLIEPVDPKKRSNHSYMDAMTVRFVCGYFWNVLMRKSMLKRTKVTVN